MRARADCLQLGRHGIAVAALLSPALLAIPALLGMFWGAPLVAREFESGTHRLAWTQSVTRRRWLSVRVGLVGVTALAVAGLASWLVTWWFAPLDAVNMNRFDPGVFTARGVVAIGYAGFAFGLGVAAGALTRRTLPAMAATLFAFIAARIAFTVWIRPVLLASRHVLLALGHSIGFLASPSGATIFAGVPAIPNAWTLSATLVDRAHHALTATQLHDLLVRNCPSIATGLPPNPVAAPGGPVGPAGGAFVSCLHTLSGHLQVLVAYQPSSHYWPLQALETTIFLAAGLALIGATVWRVGRRGGRRVGRRPADAGTGMGVGVGVGVGGLADRTPDRPSPQATPEIGVAPVRIAGAGP